MEGDKDITSANSSTLTGVDHHSMVDPEGQTNGEENEREESLDEKGSQQDPNIVDWDGPNDPENPLNWPTSKKVTAIGVISLITLLSPLASTIISPATVEVLETFHSTSETLGAFITSVYLLGYTFGPLLIAPLSELYGRVIVYNVCNFIFLIFNIACALAPNLGGLIAFRFFSGIAASCPITLGAGSIADMIPHERRGLAMASWIIGPLVGPSFGPLAGAYLAQAKSWRWIFWVISMAGGAVAVVAVLMLRESYPYVILKRKTERLREQTGNVNLRSKLDNGKSTKDHITFSVVRPLKMLLLSPIVFLLSLYMAIVYGYLYLLFTTFPRIFQGQYGFSNGSVGLVYIGVGVGSFFGLIFTAAVSDRQVQILAKRYGGAAKPEYRLPAMILGAFIIPIGLFLYGWSAEKKLHWFLPVLGTAFLGAGLFIIMMPAAVYLVDAYTIHAASAAAAATVFRSLLGAFLPLAGGSMYDALGVGWGTSVLAFIAVAFIPVPFLFFKYGQRIRESKFFKVEF